MWGRPSLIRLNFGRIFDRYVGTSEKNMRAALMLTREATTGKLGEVYEQTYEKMRDVVRSGGVLTIFKTDVRWQGGRT